MSLEQEIKLIVTQQAAIDLSTISWLTALSQAEPKQLHLVSTYFDTPDRALMKSGVGLRLRQVDQQWLQTVKCSGDVANGLHQRKEWEHTLDGPAFDLALLQQTELAPLVANKMIWSAVEPVFTTDFERTVMPLRLEDGSEVELAYDRGEIRAGQHKALIHEVELELKQGELKKMLELAQSLQAALPLQYSDISKAKQGYALSQAVEK
ncbi:CYTH domain-containing protein [Methylophaga sp. OBS4]|uniref:CYTH domain-containing protein n=1 Tax=Methylophaga sp. OBS4 TaxID=2991935 RepID=UPI0022567C6E|nr:CYTH domain-containing protein [Methylophaga sp. OBS4]MCX4188140.1 CYTH domain-containing protein [Methylophaga sp. OBS4]